MRTARDRVENQAQKNRQLALENCELEPKFREAKERLTAKIIEATELENEYKKGFEELSKWLKQVFWQSVDPIENANPLNFTA